VTGTIQGWEMIVPEQFSMTRDEVFAVSLKAANFRDDPFKSPVVQLRRLLNM